jgi:hypothetical protein
MGLGSGIRDPESGKNLFQIPDRSQKGTRSRIRIRNTGYRTVPVPTKDREPHILLVEFSIPVIISTPNAGTRLAVTDKITNFRKIFCILAFCTYQRIVIWSKPRRKKINYTYNTISINDLAWLHFPSPLVLDARNFGRTVLRNRNRGNFCLSGTETGTVTIWNHRSSHRHGIKLCI